MEVAAQQDTANTGVLRFAYCKDATLWNLDCEMFCTLQELSRDCWPVKVNADHSICWSQEMIRVILPFTRATKGKEQRIRSTLHEVPDSKITEELATYGIPRHTLPSDIGGTMDFNIIRWIANRREIETEETDLFPIEETDSCSDFGLLSCSDFGLDETDETDETDSCTSSEEKSVFVDFDLLELDFELLDEVEDLLGLE